MRCYLLILLATLTACAGQPQYVALRQTVDGLTVTLERPREVVALQDHEVFVTLADAQGRPVDDATVYLDQSMPGMVMGVNQPIAEGLGGGRYRVSTVYAMEGNWRVVVHARVGGKEYVAGFDYPVALPKT
ncbi:MAG TPA: FixH family protein [Roseiflexaceae bacterium]|nr:FixH family protein [Roseiflexaceae bacterium]